VPVRVGVIISFADTLHRRTCVFIFPLETSRSGGECFALEVSALCFGSFAEKEVSLQSTILTCGLDGAGPVRDKGIIQMTYADACMCLPRAGKERLGLPSPKSPKNVLTDRIS